MRRRPNPLFFAGGFAILTDVRRPVQGAPTSATRPSAGNPTTPMIPAITSLNPVAILVVSVLCFLIGGLWYSPLLFVKAWMKEMKITPESMKAQDKSMAKTMGTAFLLTVISTTTLASLLAMRHTMSALSGAELGFFVGAGLVAAREGTNAVFESRTFKHFAIVAGHDITLLVIQGAILAVWR